MILRASQYRGQRPALGRAHRLRRLLSPSNPNSYRGAHTAGVPGSHVRSSASPRTPRRCMSLRSPAPLPSHSRSTLPPQRPVQRNGGENPCAPTRARRIHQARRKSTRRLRLRRAQSYSTRRVCRAGRAVPGVVEAGAGARRRSQASDPLSSARSRYITTTLTAFRALRAPDASSVRPRRVRVITIPITTHTAR